MLRTDCPVCRQSVGLQNPYRGPNAHGGPRKRILHGNPHKPKRNGRMARCDGSCIEVDDFAIYEIEGTKEELRKRREMESA